MKKILVVVITFFLTMMLVACEGLNVSKYTVSFDTNGGTPDIIEDVVVKKGAKISNPVVTKTGFDLEYWYVKDDHFIWNFNVDTVSKDMKLIASWKKITGEEKQEFTVFFDTNGGSLIDSVTVLESQKLLRPDNPTKDGQIFYLWLLDDEPFDFDQVIKQDLTLVASWVDGDNGQVLLNKTTASYSGSSSINFANDETKNHANLLNLNEHIFTVTGKSAVGPSYTNEIGLNKDGTIRLYSTAEGLGNTLVISSDRIITKIEILFGDGKNNPSSARLSLDDNNVNLNNDDLAKDHLYVVDNLQITSFSLSNNHLASGVQIWIKEINITYQDVESKNSLTTEQKMLAAFKSLSTLDILGDNFDGNQVSKNLILPATFLGVSLLWSSSNNNAISNTGVIGHVLEDEVITLTVTLSLEGQTLKKMLTVTVLKNNGSNSGEITTKTVIAEYRGTANKNLNAITTLNQASELNLDPNVFTLTAKPTSYTGNQTIGLYVGSDGKANVMRLYSDRTGGNGNEFTIKGNNIVITKIEMKFSSPAQDRIPLTALLILGDVLVNLTTADLVETTLIKDQLKIDEFTFKLNHIGPTSAQVWIEKMIITYESREEVSDLTDQEKLDNAYHNLTEAMILGNNNNLNEIIRNLNLPTTLNNVNISWVSNHPSIDHLGVVTRDNDNNINVVLTAVLTIGSLSKTKVFQVVVLQKTHTSNPSDDDPVIKNYYNFLTGLTGTSWNNALENKIKTTGTQTGTTAQVKSIDAVGSSYYLIYDGMGSYGNREHTVPASYLREVNRPEDDLHNLRAANINTNSTRSNYPFGQGTGKQWVLSGSKFYPGSDHIGDVARIVFYMAIRNGISFNKLGGLSMFLQWHELDPVDDFERTRNERIYNIQKSRNPFIDYPEYAEMLLGSVKVSYVFSGETLLSHLDNHLEFVMVDYLYIDFNNKNEYLM